MIHDHECVWEKWACYEEPVIELVCARVDCLAILDPSAPDYESIMEGAAWF